MMPCTTDGEETARKTQDTSAVVQGSPCPPAPFAGFEQFYRVPTEPRTDSGGLGIALYISRGGIVEAHGGRLCADYECSSFAFSVPGMTASTTPSTSRTRKLVTANGWKSVP